MLAAKTMNKSEVLGLISAMIDFEKDVTKKARLKKRYDFINLYSNEKRKFDNFTLSKWGIKVDFTPVKVSKIEKVIKKEEQLTFF